MLKFMNYILAARANSMQSLVVKFSGANQDIAIQDVFL